jgi:hypothetical protein
MSAARLLHGRSLRVAVITAAALVSAVGVMHTRAGRQALIRLGVPCPAFGATATQVSALREVGLQTLRGGAPAPQRPAAGLQLDATTEAQASAWAANRRLGCEALQRGYRYLRCRGVPASALGLDGPPVSELWLSFGPRDTLVGVDVYRRGLAPADEALVWHSATTRLRAALGAPSVAFGDGTPASLRAAAVTTARVQYRYADYIATVTAARLPGIGLAVREQYLSAQRPTS